MPRKILIATSTRADWGLLSPVARMLADMAGIEVKVMATNMHLDPVRGNTLDEIRGDGFEPVAAYMPTGYATGADAARAMADGARSAADVIEGESPDIVVVLGDRFEILGIAAVANVMRVPVVHISGGEVTEGAFDDNFRHAVTKLSALHLVSTADYRRRVIQLGEEPDRVIDTGAIGVANVMEDTGLTVGELEVDIDFHFFPVSLLVTLHPATLSDIPARESVSHLLAALDRFPDINLLFTYPNNDPEGEEIIRAIDAYAAADRAGRVRVVPSLGRRRYHTALRGVSAVVGNSSSGIMEVPSAGIPTVDIGIRQRGRLSPASVIHCDDSADAIAAAIARALETDCSGMANPYYKPDTVKLIADAIAYTPMKLLRRPKRFYDLS